MKSFYLILLSTLLLGVSCKSDSKESQSEPQSIFVKWQKLVDAGDFAKAKVLSTPSTIQWLEEIAEIDADDSTYISNEFTQIQNLSCTIEGDTASCSYQIIEEGEKLSNSIQLVKVKGKWLVDIHDDPEELMDDFF